jgi:hypothetical protein
VVKNTSSRGTYLIEHLQFFTNEISGICNMQFSHKKLEDVISPGLDKFNGAAQNVSINHRQTSGAQPAQGHGEAVNESDFWTCCLEDMQQQNQLKKSRRVQVIHWFMQVEQQIKLALRISKSVLQFPNIAYKPSSVIESGINRSSSIRNEALLRLGINLLEIAWWLPLETLRPGYSDRATAAYCIARKPHRLPLGPEYDRLAIKCIFCDFGTTSDNLQDVELQQAVQSKVVDVLEHMLERLSV